ncbi:hypothetical protein, partial [Paenibacillus sp. 598K]|uniref:hypothetical protein n=1 Tax=Paenibacillus sp. 598K TaxID=1117987 RepID=UPI001C887959
AGRLSQAADEARIDAVEPGTPVVSTVLEFGLGCEQSLFNHIMVFQDFGLSIRNWFIAASLSAVTYCGHPRRGERR